MDDDLVYNPLESKAKEALVIFGHTGTNIHYLGLMP